VSTGGRSSVFEGRPVKLTQKKEGAVDSRAEIPATTPTAGGRTDFSVEGWGGGLEGGWGLLGWFGWGRGGGWGWGGGGGLGGGVFGWGVWGVVGAGCPRSLVLQREVTGATETPKAKFMLCRGGSTGGQPFTIEEYWRILLRRTEGERDPERFLEIKKRTKKKIDPRSSTREVRRGWSNREMNDMSRAGGGRFIKNERAAFSVPQGAQTSKREGGDVALGIFKEDGSKNLSLRSRRRSRERSGTARKRQGGEMLGRKVRKKREETHEEGRRDARTVNIINVKW